MSRTEATPFHRLSRRELFLIFLFWTSLAALSAVNRLLDPRGGLGFRMSPAAPVTFAFVEAWFWALMTPLIFRLGSYFSRFRWVVRLALLALIGVVFALAADLLLSSLRELIFPMMHHHRPMGMRPMREMGRLLFVHQLLVYFAILTAGFARELFLRDQSRQREAVELQAQLADARLQALRMQINPHFLFNTLHAVSALVERDPAGVRKMIARLSELLRHTIDSRGTAEVRLREELDFLQRYIDIMEIRFQGKLEVVTTIDPVTLEALVPNLILQPIVENALEHGVSRRAAGGRVEIISIREGESLVLTVRDNGPGISDQLRDGGVGLANTRERLAQLYGDDAELSITSDPEGGAVAVITLPFHVEERVNG